MNTHFQNYAKRTLYKYNFAWRYFGNACSWLDFIFFMFSIRRYNPPNTFAGSFDNASPRLYSKINLIILAYVESVSSTWIGFIGGKSELILY
jgi:hypothetical protein